VDCAGAGGSAVRLPWCCGCQAVLNPPVEDCGQNMSSGMLNMDHRSFRAWLPSSPKGSGGNNAEQLCGKRDQPGVGSTLEPTHDSQDGLRGLAVRPCPMRQPGTNRHWRVPYLGAGYTVIAVSRTFTLCATVNFQATK
jgi:hypothetical protein